MNASKLKQKISVLLFSLSIAAAMGLCALSCPAQSLWEASEVKAEKLVFYVDKVGSHFFIRNSNYIDPTKTRMQYNYTWFEFSYVSLISHDAFLEVFKESFTAGRLTQLATTSDPISITINVDEKGQIFGVNFLLHEETTIMPEELEKLEQELLSRARFVVIGKKLEDHIFHRVTLRIFFSEVLDGEIRDVRYSVNLKTTYQE